MTRIKIYNLEQYLEQCGKGYSGDTGRRFTKRLFDHDHTLWSDDPEEISNRLGWLESPEYMLEKSDDINSFVDECKSAGFNKVLLLGMGGSSLAPELFNDIFHVPGNGLELRIADSTHPDKIEELKEYFEPADTLCIVSTKSGGTVETISQMNFFYNLFSESLGNKEAGSHFVAITDPGSKLEEFSSQLGFRRCFLNDPNIGGRFSVLSYFGLVPAALVGVDIKKLLSRSIDLRTEIQNGALDLNSNPLYLGTLLGQLANDSLDKLTFLISGDIYNFGDWLEQLIAESSGKLGKGILPVLEPDTIDIRHLSGDRVFVCISLNNDPSVIRRCDEIRSEGFPLIHMDLGDKYDLGREFYCWEIVTAAACRVLGVNPFDQPNVESAKVLARKFLSEYKESGIINEPDYHEVGNGIRVVSSVKSETLAEAVRQLIPSNGKSTNEYISIQAYIAQNSGNLDKLEVIKHILNEKTGIPVTIGFGPRFLHSTGQLHKGDNGNGKFIQIVSEPDRDFDIPDNAGSDKSSLSFGTLIKSQYLGDRSALIDSGRKVLTINIGNDAASGLDCIINSITSL